MPLTDPACKNASCPTNKPRARFSDSGGLYLEVAPNGSKRWFWKYKFVGKEKRLALGSYPETRLKVVRMARDDARKLQRSGIDPVQQRQADKRQNIVQVGDSFETVARELHGIKGKGWSTTYADHWIQRLEKDAFPWIGTLPLDKITAPLLLQTIRRVESRGAHETAHTLRRTAGQVFMYGIATSRCDRNPAPDLHGALTHLSQLGPRSAGKLLI